MKKAYFTLIALLFILPALWAGPGSATSITFSGSSGSLSASAVFTLLDSKLTIMLTNTSPADVLLPTDVLSGLYFDTSHLLTPVSASLDGSSVYYGWTNNPGDGWGYASDIDAQGKNSGISSTDAVKGLKYSNFSSKHKKLGGLDYGILSTGDNSKTGNTGVTGQGPLFKDSLEFTLAAGKGFTLDELGDTVVFQYGTALNSPHYLGFKENDGGTPVPEPTTLLMLGAGLVGLWGIRKKLKK